MWIPHQQTGATLVSKKFERARQIHVSQRGRVVFSRKVILKPSYFACFTHHGRFLSGWQKLTLSLSCKEEKECEKLIALYRSIFPDGAAEKSHDQTPISAGSK